MKSELTTEMAKGAIKKVSEEVAAACDVVVKHRAGVKEERGKILEEYHALLAKFVLAYEKDTVEDEMINGICCEFDRSEFAEEIILDAGKDVVRFYRQHEADLQIHGLRKYQKEIQKRIEAYYFEGSLFDNTELLQVVKRAKTIVAKKL